MSSSHSYQAILISGDEARHIKATRDIHEYLLEKAAYNPSDITILANTELFGIEQVIKKTSKDPLVITYVGHGSKQGIHPLLNEPRQCFQYTQLAELIQQYHPQNSLVMLGACYSGAAIDVFRKHNLLDNNQVITAASARKTTSGVNFIRVALLYGKLQKPLPKKIASNYLQGRIILTPDHIIERELSRPKPIGNKINTPREGKDLFRLLFAANKFVPRETREMIPSLDVEIEESTVRIPRTNSHRN